MVNSFRKKWDTREFEKFELNNKVKGLVIRDLT